MRSALFQLTGDGQTMTKGLLRAASAIGHLEVVRELLERGGERRLANRPRLHRARGCCGPRPPLSSAPPAAALLYSPATKRWSLLDHPR